MNKELEQAAERIANQLFNLTADTIDGITKYQNGNELLQSAKLLILTDPLILELVKDRERLDWLGDDATEMPGILSSRYVFKRLTPICGHHGANESIRTAIDSAIEQGKKVGV